MNVQNSCTQQILQTKTNSSSVCCSCTNPPASYVAAQYDAKALKESRKELVDGHVGHRGRAHQGIVGYVLPMDQHVVVGNLHDDDGWEGGQDSQVMAGEYLERKTYHGSENRQDRDTQFNHAGAGGDRVTANCNSSPLEGTQKNPRRIVLI